MIPILRTHNGSKFILGRTKLDVWHQPRRLAEPHRYWHAHYLKKLDMVIDIFHEVNSYCGRDKSRTDEKRIVQKRVIYNCQNICNIQRSVYITLLICTLVSSNGTRSVQDNLKTWYKR